MKPNSPRLAVLLAVIAFSLSSVLAQESTPALTAAEKEAFYVKTLEDRAAAILKELAVTDQKKSDKLHDAIIAQYRALRTRDEALGAKLKSTGKEAEGTGVDLAVQAHKKETKTLHDQFLALLATELTPEQVEAVKDKMTFGKVKFTYDAYCNIVPSLTDKEKARILELLKAAREEAIDGGSTSEKTEIFQKYKDQINAYLTGQGHDLDKAFKDWDAKQELAKAKTEPATNATTPVAK